jgi:hypothetical protein
MESKAYHVAKVARFHLQHIEKSPARNYTIAVAAKKRFPPDIVRRLDSMDTPVPRRLNYMMTLLGYLPVICLLMAGQLSARQLLIEASWSGNFPVEALSILPEGQQDTPIGYIETIEQFAALWQRFQPDQPIPEVDFTRSLVIFARNTEYYNAIRIGAIQLKNGTADIIAMQTMSARPIEDLVGMSLAIAPREGIERIRAGVQEIEVE